MEERVKVIPETEDQRDQRRAAEVPLSKEEEVLVKDRMEKHQGSRPK